jgi:hypothetical protein
VLGTGFGAGEIVTPEAVMRRRKLRWLLLLVGLAVVVAVGAFALWPRKDRITRENFDRIQNGMSLAEVEAILGPPGDHRTRPTTYEPHFLEPPRLADRVASQPAVDIKKWQGDAGDVEVVFSNGKRSAAFYATDPVNQGPLDNLLWRAKRLWRRLFRE